MEHSESTKQVQTALVKVHAQMHNPGTTTKNAFLGNEYLPLPQLIEYARPVLAEHGLAILQTPTSDGERIGVTTTIIHESGEWLRDSVSLLVESRKGNSLAQVAGGTITYLRRYAYAAACGVAPDPDDDGNHGVNPNNGNGHSKNADIDKAHKLTAQYITESTLSDVRKKSYAQTLEDAYNNNDIGGIRAVYKKVSEAQKQTDEEPPKQEPKEEDLF